MTSPTKEMVLERIEVDPESGCWLWKLSRTTAGYGQAYDPRRPRKRALAHRISYEVFVGPVPDGLQLDHLCRVRHCVNPAHLEPVTLAENMRRGYRATRTHCTHGHEYTEENTLLTRGFRECRACRAERNRRARRKNVAVQGGATHRGSLLP